MAEGSEGYKRSDTIEQQSPRDSMSAIQQLQKDVGVLWRYLPPDVKQTESTFDDLQQAYNGDTRKYTQSLFDSYSSHLDINDERQRRLGERQIEKQLENVRLVVGAHLGEERASQILANHKKEEERNKAK